MLITVLVKYESSFNSYLMRPFEVGIRHLKVAFCNGTQEELNKMSLQKIIYKPHEENVQFEPLKLKNRIVHILLGITETLGYLTLVIPFIIIIAEKFIFNNYQNYTNFLTTTFSFEISGKKIDVIPLSSIKDFSNIPDELGMDYRVSKHDTSESLSFLKGLDVDPNYRRSQIFLIKDGKSIIGLSTILITPFKHLSKMGFIKDRVNNNSVVLKSIAEILNIKTSNTYIITLGWLKISPKYRGKKIAKTTVCNVILPTVKKIISTYNKYNNFITLCSATGLADSNNKRQFKSKWLNSLNKKSEATIELANKHLLGQVHPEAQFTFFMARNNKFKKLSDVYNFSFGPVFIKKD
jgi:hypothetical protein